MIFLIIHIVRNGEKISNILNNYNISFDDLKTNNLHITDFSKLAQGTKLRIPTLNQETIQILNGSEPLVSSYYEGNNIFEEDNNVNNQDDNNQDDNNINDNSNNGNNTNNGSNFRGLNILPGFGFPKVIRNGKRQIYPHFINKKNDK